MRESLVNIWSMYDTGSWIVITTNGNVNTAGEAVMGKGIALAAKQKFSGIEKTLGYWLKVAGNHVFLLEERVLSFPTKTDWWLKSDMGLIVQSATELRDYVEQYPTRTYYMPRPGCGNGGLTWEAVKAQIEHILPDNVIVCGELWEQNSKC